jgi:mono/diheme cytochrome c family protein
MRLLIRIVAGLAIAALVAGVVLWFASGRVLHRHYDVALRPLQLPRDAGSVAEGARLATLVGCRSCHNEGRGGAWEPVDWSYGRVAPPAFPEMAARYSDAELARLIQHGVRKDGTSVFVMPSWSQRWLADRDVARIIAWMRTLKPSPADSPLETWFGPKARWQMLTGSLQPSAQVETVAAADRPADAGRYFVHALCFECHELHRPHAGEHLAPALAPMAASYDPADFRKLLHTGVGAGGRDVGFMGTIARENLHALSDAEIDQIHAYLKAEAATR